MWEAADCLPIVAEYIGMHDNTRRGNRKAQDTLEYDYKYDHGMMVRGMEGWTFSPFVRLLVRSF